MLTLKDMSVRRLLNMPEYYEKTACENISFSEVLSHAVPDLIRMLEDDSLPLINRIAAGNTLALRGDQRIEVFNPQMAHLPSATINVGSTHSEIEMTYQRYKSVGVIMPWLEKEFPKHSVDIRSFRIAIYPVTNSEYLSYLQDVNGGEIPTSWDFGKYNQGKSNHPVFTVSGEAAQNYTLWLAKKTGRKFRLPTEYEWEYAATGGLEQEFPWGNEFTTDKANTLENKLLSTTPVGIYPQGKGYFGCFDLAGNVEEYVSDKYFAYPGGSVISDDLGTEHGYYMTRGGGFTRYSDLARCRRRHGYHPHKIFAIGFRLAEDI